MKRRKLKLKFKGVLLALLILVLLVYATGVVIYQTSLSAVSSAETPKEVIIEKGISTQNIAKLLKEKNLIKNEYTFLIYIKLHKVNDLKYGTYLFAENMGVKRIVEFLQNGSDYNPDEVTITFREGINMREIAKTISTTTNNTYEDVMAKSNDLTYIQSLKEKYWFITDEILNDQLYYKLEGYLFPDTYRFKNREITVEEIFNKMLDEMAKNLEGYQNFDYTTLSIHSRLTLASMIEKESPVKEDRSKMASVFLNRMAKGMNLGSDVTARYANKIDDKKKVLSESQLNIKSPYNTRQLDGSMNGRLAIGPIATISKASIDAAFNPDNGPYLYFISNIQTLETFFYENYNDFLAKKEELKEVNKGF